MQTVTVIGRRWFERTNGNTYHSVTVYVDGELVEYVPFRYGYDRQYEQTAMEVLQSHGYLADAAEYGGLIRRWANVVGVTLISEVADVGRKKDL